MHGRQEGELAFASQHAIERNNLLDQFVEVVVAGGGQPAEEVASPGDDMYLQHLGHISEALHYFIVGALGDREGGEGGDAMVGRSGVKVWAPTGDDASVDQASQPHLDGASGQAEPMS